MNFESLLKELNTLIETTEKGGLNLEDALKNFERGIQLTRECQAALKAAEQKVQILIEENGFQKLESFDENDEP